MTRTRTWCRFVVVGLHHWREAPATVAHLRPPHRHAFHVTLEVDAQPVGHDRPVEFLALQATADAAFRALATLREDLTPAILDFGQMSCEEMAAALLGAVPGAVRCSVSEDGENGATVEVLS